MAQELAVGLEADGTKAYWLDKLALMGLDEAPKVSDEFLRWKRKHDARMAEVEWKDVRDTRVSAMRREHGAPRKEEEKGRSVPCIQDTLSGLETRLLGSVSDSDVAAEHLLKEMPLLDSVGAEITKLTYKISPDSAAAWEMLWGCAMRCVGGTLGKQLEQSLTVRDERDQACADLRSVSLKLSRLELEHRKTTSKLASKSEELTRSVKALSLLREELSDLRRTHKLNGIRSAFDPMRLGDSMAALDEAEEASKAAGRVIDEIGKLVVVAAEGDERRESDARRLGEEMPKAWRARTLKLEAEVRELAEVLGERDAEVAVIREQLREAQEHLSRRHVSDIPMTPRPDWKRIFEYVVPQLGDTPMPESHTGVGQKVAIRDAAWVGSTGDKIETLCDTLSKLLPSLTEQEDIGCAGAYFEPLGMGSDVPKFLRTKVRVRNRNITKRETEHVIKEIWRARRRDLEAEAEGRGGHRPTVLTDFVFNWIRQRVGAFPHMICEMGYNLMDGCRRHGEDADVEIFKLVVDGEMGEAVVIDQDKQVQALLSRFRRADKDTHSGVYTGNLTRARFDQLVADSFPHRSRQRLKYLLDSVEMEHPCGKYTPYHVPLDPTGKGVLYEGLFLEDEFYSQGPFLEGVRDQYVLENREFMAYLERNAKIVCDRGGGMPLQACRDAIRMTDSGTPDAELVRLVCAAFKRPPKSPPTPADKLADVATFMRNVKQTHVRWHSSATINVNGVEITV